MWCIREHVRSEEIRIRMHLDRDIIDTINTKRVIWYGQVQRVPEGRWPKRLLEWIANRRRREADPGDRGGMKLNLK